MVESKSELRLLPAKIRQRRHRAMPGEILFRRGDRVTRLYAVRSGNVRLVRHLPQGSVLTLQRAGSGDWLAEASLFAERYHCDAVVDGADMISVSRPALLKSLQTQPRLMMAWLHKLSENVQQQRGRAEILGCRTVSERLDAWLALHEKKPETLSWRKVADELAVSPEALYRELARRR